VSFPQDQIENLGTIASSQWTKCGHAMRFFSLISLHIPLESEMVLIWHSPDLSRLSSCWFRASHLVVTARGYSSIQLSSLRAHYIEGLCLFPLSLAITLGEKGGKRAFNANTEARDDNRITACSKAGVGCLWQRKWVPSSWCDYAWKRTYWREWHIKLGFPRRSVSEGVPDLLWNSLGQLSAAY